MRFKRQWWWYEVRTRGRHVRTYLSKRDAIGFALQSQKVKGGAYVVYRRTKKRTKRVETFLGERHE